MLDAGRVLQAREHLLANISLAPSEILHELGKTFDPFYLTKLPTSDVIASPKQAVSLYREALKYGANGASQDLERLLKSRPNLR